ncbi:hypothetical protein KGM_207880 [Danaus plexippus plexippus]|uniref:Uncharacterized protein n=1 Tax=Danaus plexippus plexippus TaxID=278856 RepID=A0A212ETE3_DANPL|nr:hypothetical protein KGM_207880 [Danaus plexippus plexippus]
MSNICQRYIRRYCEEKSGSYMELLSTLSTDLDEMLTEIYDDDHISRSKVITNYSTSEKTKSGIFNIYQILPFNILCL